MEKYRLEKDKGMEYIIQNKKYINRIKAEITLLGEPGIHTIQIVGGTQKGMHNAQTRIQNKSYLTTIYMAKNWDQNKNSHENCPRDTEKPPQ